MERPDFPTCFLGALPDAAQVLAEDYSILYLNDRACLDYQVTKDEAIGKKCFTLLGEAEPCQNCPLSEVFKTGIAVEKEIFRFRKQAWYLLKIFPIESCAKTACVGAISKDITPTKTAEQILVDFNYKVKNFIDRMPIGCILWDENFKVSMWNPAAEKIFGYSEEEVRGKHPYEIIVPPDVIAKTDPVKTKLLKGHDSSHRTGDNITKDGRRIYCHWINTPVQDVTGDVISVLSMVQDMTHERQLQNEAIRAAQLATIGQLSASIAHEINNPISGVINYSQILLNHQEPFNASQIDILQRINKEGIRIANYVKSLLNFSRKPPEIMVPQDMDVLLKEAIGLLKPAIRKANITIAVDTAKGKPIIRCNPQQVEQVIINILKNAIDALDEATQPEKKIQITSKIALRNGERQFHFSIANNGPPIPDHMKEKIFEPFLTTKADGIGTGLGLSISLEIMKNHGGTIIVNSAPGTLTEMIMVFPLSPLRDNTD